MRSFLLPILLLGTWHVIAAVPDFGREVLPILSENCFQCHGQDAKGRKADLRLDVEAAAKRAIDGVSPILPGNANKSSIIQRMTTTDVDEVMPPPKSHKRVTPAQVDTIRRWIDGGAKWGKHWAFERVQAPAVPSVPGVETSLDAFVKAKLATKSWDFAAPAPPEILCRRLHLDLIGLPPTLEAVDQFVAQHARDPKQAVSDLVDRLLADPRHGERWVWEWLDASRYADSNGYQGDLDRTAWPWRDWVIRAINDNLRYDQFTVWQLAGDLLPNPTREQRLATAFVRNHMINGEGGRIAEENRIEYLFDQAETVGTVWLGLTMQCTRCHDHKFDALTQRDYFGMIAFFNTTSVDGAGRSGQTAPVLDMSTPVEEQRSREAQKRYEAAAKEVDAFETIKFPRPAGKGLADSDAIKLPGNLPATLAKTLPQRRGVDAVLEAIGYFEDKDPAYTKVLNKLLAAVRQRDSARSNITKVMVMEERKEGPRDTFILEKGAYDAPTKEKVPMLTPSALPPMANGAPRNRLGLAQWIVSRDNPLTARVTVNRYWQSLFGVGLVKTAEDFGVQGERPLHMDLLDYLSADFMDHGWDVKRLLKTIVTSRTYQQGASAARHDGDPENRYIGRGPRFRLPSFMLRDQALAVSGLLAPKMGGPSVKPYQPDGIWEEATFGKVKYVPGTGSDLYRRSLYTFWRRIVGPTMFFDNSARQTCVTKAGRTNTPLHALVTLNETTFVESARNMAQRLLLDRSLPSDLDRIERAWRLVTSRRPTTKELQTMALTLEQLRAQYDADKDGASKLLSTGESKRDGGLDAAEHAAWTSVCLMLFNLDEALTKE